MRHITYRQTYTNRAEPSHNSTTIYVFRCEYQKLLLVWRSSDSPLLLAFAAMPTKKHISLSLDFINDMHGTQTWQQIDIETTPFHIYWIFCVLFVLRWASRHSRAHTHTISHFSEMRRVQSYYYYYLCTRCEWEDRANPCQQFTVGNIILQWYFSVSICCLCRNDKRDIRNGDGSLEFFVSVHILCGGATW